MNTLNIDIFKSAVICSEPYPKKSDESHKVDADTGLPLWTLPIAVPVNEYLTEQLRVTVPSASKPAVKPGQRVKFAGVIIGFYNFSGASGLWAKAAKFAPVDDSSDGLEGLLENE